MTKIICTLHYTLLAW